MERSGVYMSTADQWRPFVKACCLLFLSLLLALPIWSQTQSSRVQTLKVQSAWGGLGQPAHSEISIQRQGDSYKAGGRVIPGAALYALENAIQAPVLGAPVAANLGVSAEWLHQYGDRAGAHTSRLHYREGLPEQKVLFRKAFEDQQTLPSRIEEVYKSFHTDDYPHMRMQLTLQDGTQITLTTDSQNPYMLPWCITSQGKTQKTYNADISRALFALLPPKFDNRDRLTEHGLADMIGENTANTVEQRWNLLGAQHASGDALAVLKNAYEVRSATVDSYHDLAFGKAWDGGEPHEENLHATLWRHGFPEGFTVTAILLRQNGNTEGASELLKRAPAYEDLVFSVPWLDDYLKSHPKERTWLFYVHGESLTDKPMKVFAADMKAIGRNDLIERVRAVQQQAALFESGHGDTWIVLPDKTIIMWRWQSLDHILKWKVNEFPAHECTDYWTVSGGCAGVVISPSGQIEPGI